MTLKYVDPWAARYPSEDQIKSLQQPATAKNQNSGIFGDFVDAFQQGAYQSAAGDAEAVGQISDSDTFKSIGKALAKGANNQTDTMTVNAKQALSQHIFKDDPDSFTGVAFDDGATNWRTWALQFGALGGQVAGTVATGFGAGTVVKFGAKQVIKSVAKKAITKEARQLVAKNAVKEAIRNGALDDVRTALIAAPDKAAINAVLNKATSRLGGIATTAVAGSMAAGMRAQQARDEYLGLDADTLNQNPEFQEAYWEIADNPENQGLDTATIHNAAKEMLAEKAATTAFFDKKALLSDFASGAYVPGAGGVIGRGAATTSKMGRFGLGLAQEGATGAWQGGETQRAVNEAIKEWGDESRDPMANVVRTRWEEGTLGGVFGGMAKVVEGQHVAPSKPIVTVEQPALTGNSLLDGALAQSSTDEQSRYDTLTGHVDDLSKPSYMRNGEISPTLENAIVQFRLDTLQQQQIQQRQDGIMQPLDNPVTGNPDEPAFLRSRSFNPTGRDLSSAPEVDPNTPVQQALARSASTDNSIESQLSDTIARGDQGKTPQEDFLTGEIVWNDGRAPIPPSGRIEQGMVVDGQANEVLPESRGIGYNGTINAGGASGDGINSAYVPPVTADRVSADRSMGSETIIDPRTPIGQSIAQAGSETDAIFNQLKTVRVTKRGKPFGSEKEAQLASRASEMPVALPTGGFGVAEKSDFLTARETVMKQLQAQQSNNVDVNEIASSPVVAQNQPNINVNGSNNGQATSKQSILDQVDVNKHGDRLESPWLFSDGKIVSSNGDHISLSSEYGYAGYRDMSIGTGAIRSWFFKPNKNHTHGETPFVSLQLFDNQKLTDEQLKSVESFVKANNAKILLGVDRSGNNTNNAEQDEISLNELKDKYVKSADQVAVTPSPDTVTPPVVATDSQPTAAPSIDDEITEAIVEHTTGKGKVLRGVVRTGLTVAQAKAIDPYTFKKDGGYFIREQHLSNLPPVSEQPTQTTETPIPKKANKLRDSANRIITTAQAEQSRSRLTNTPKRAREAGSALRGAARHESIGRTMLNIADEIERNGESKLSGIDSRATVDELEGAITRSIYEADKNLTYSERENSRERDPTEKDLAHAKMPKVNVYGDWLSSAANTLEQKAKEGNVRLIANLRKLASKIGSGSAPIASSQFDLIEEAYKKLKTLKERSPLSDVSDRIAAVKRLNRAGINNDYDLRDTLKEYIQHRDGVKKEDPVKAAERALVGQKVGIDFFPTPKAVAAKMAELAGIKPGMKVLEPSAGNGNLADAAKAAGADVDVVEISSQLRSLLELKGYNAVESDFNDLSVSEEYDAILMNPPFSGRKDAQHIMKAYDHLKPGGKLVAIAGEGVFFGNDKAAVNFREWLDDQGAYVEKLPAGTFNDKSLLATTGTNARLISITKPEAESAISKNNKTEIVGKEVTLHTPSGKQVKAEYRLMEASELVASHDFDGNTNSQFPQSLQPRDRSRVASRQQLFNIAQNPMPERLADSAETDRGAPIVKDGIVESGNGRVIGLTEAYRRGNAEGYKQYLTDHAEEFGLTPEQVNRMEQPVLVRERMTEMTPEQVREFTVDSNRGAGLSLGATEQANADAAALNKDILSLLAIPENGDVLSRENESFLNAFGALLGNNELAQYKTSDGAWNQAYKRRVENAIFAKGYGNADLTAEMAESTKPEVKNLLTALMNTSSKLAELRTFDEETGGTLAGIYADAAGIVARSRRDNQSVSEIASQSDLFGGGVSEDAKMIAEWIDANARSAKKISELLSRLTSRLLDNAKNNSQADIFTGKPEEKITVTDAINEEQARRTKQTANTQRPGADLLGANTERANTGENGSAETTNDGDRERSEQGNSGVTGDGTLTYEGVTVTIPSFNEESVNSYNRAVHIAGKRDFSAELNETAKNLIDNLASPKKHLLDTAEQKQTASNLIQGYIDKEADFIRSQISDGINNPSWFVTGRDGRNMKKAAAKSDREMQKLTEHVNKSDQRRQRIIDRLIELRPEKVKQDEAFNKVSRDIKITIEAISDYMRDGRSVLEKEARKWASPKAGKIINEAMLLDSERTTTLLKGMDEALQDVGGLVKVLGGRSASGKQVAELLGGNINADTVSFSKVQQNQTELSGKGMTKPEAELATREWLKQFKTDINVQVVKDQAEFEKALADLGQPDALQEGEVANAAYLSESNTILINASAVQNPSRLRQILRHEVLAHYGLEKVVGREAYQKVMRALQQGAGTSPAIQAAFDKVTENYQGADVDELLREVFAHYAENRPVDNGGVSRLWQRVVNLVKAALQKVGFIRQSEAETALDDVLNAIAENMRNGVTNVDPETTSKVQFSKQGKTADTSSYGKVTDALSLTGSRLINWVKEQRGWGLGTLTDLQIDQIYRDITGGAVNRYQKLRAKMEADRNDILLKAETEVDPLWDAMPTAEKAAMSNLMHDATMAKLHPDKSLEENSLYQEVKEKLARAKTEKTKAEYQAELDTIKDNHRNLSERYRLTSKQGKELYQTMRKVYDDQWSELRDAIEQRIKDVMGEGGKALAAQMRLKMEQALKHGPYFPLARFGDYIIRAKKGDQYFREHFEKRRDAEAALKQYRKEGFTANLSVKEQGSGDQANMHALGMDIMEALDKAQAEGTAPSELKDTVWQAMLEMLPDASFAKHAIHRKRTKGASRDGHRAYLNSVYHYAHHVSKIKYGHKMKAELDGMKEQVKAAERNEESSIKADDIEVAQQVLNEMNKRHELNMNPKGSALSGKLGNLGFMFYLGASPAAAVINLTQNFMVMLPQLAGKFGVMKASSFMLKAMGDYIKHGVFKSGTKEAWVSLTRAKSGITADEKAMLNALYHAGALDLTQAHSIAARADTDLQDAKHSAKWVRTGMQWAGSLFHNAEVLNREVAALTAYRLLKEKNPKINMDEAVDQVTEMVYDGHGNYAASNRPRFMRNDVAKVLTQFKIYSQMMTYTMISNAIKAAKGDKAALKTLGVMTGTTFMMAGMMGMPTPITLLLYGIAAAIDDDDDRSWEASFRLGLSEVLGPELGELVANGPLDQATNLNISGRVGMNNLWWRDPKEGTEGDDLTFHYVQQIAGPVLGIGVSAVRGLRSFADGDIQRGVEAVSPKVVKDLAKAYRQASEGEKTRNGDSVIDDVGAWNVAMQAMGFSSAQMEKVYSAREYIKGKEKIIEDRRSNLLADYFTAMREQDTDAMQDVMDNIREFNASHNKAEAITGKTLKQSIKSRERSGERTQAGTYLSSKREYLRSEGAFLKQE